MRSFIYRTMRAITAIFDGSQLLNGSFNWTRCVFTSNREKFLVTMRTSPVAQFSDAFDAMWNDFA